MKTPLTIVGEICATRALFKKLWSFRKCMNTQLLDVNCHYGPILDASQEAISDWPTGAKLFRIQSDGKKVTVKTIVQMLLKYIILSWFISSALSIYCRAIQHGTAYNTANKLKTLFGFWTQRNAHAPAHGSLWGLFDYFRNITARCHIRIVYHGEIEQSMKVW